MVKPQPRYLARFRLSEVTPQRAREAVQRRLLQVPHILAWSANGREASKNKARLAGYQGRHNGQRCFIIGNGPSLKTMDLTPLKNEVTFGLNRIYLLFDQLGFEPTYYVCINELVLEQFAPEIQSCSMPKFLNWNRRRLFSLNDERTLFLRMRLGIKDAFDGNLARPRSSGGTVTYVAIQIAFAMGFHEVVLIGVDHYYRDRGTPNTAALRVQELDVDHFHPQYFPKGSLWQPPDLLRSEVAFRLARCAFEDDSRRIVDATVGGQCPVFEKLAYESLVEFGRDRGID